MQTATIMQMQLVSATRLQTTTLMMLILIAAGMFSAFQLGRIRERMAIWKLDKIITKDANFHSLVLHEFISIFGNKQHRLSEDEIRKLPWIKSLIDLSESRTEETRSLNQLLASIQRNWDSQYSGYQTFDEFWNSVAKLGFGGYERFLALYSIIKELDYQMEMRTRAAVANNDCKSDSGKVINLDFLPPPPEAS